MFLFHLGDESGMHDLSNIYSREEYRKTSITAPAVDGTICGFGQLSYLLAIDAINNILRS